MAPRRVANPRRSAKYYRENPEARAKKAETDKKFNKKPEQRAKRAELVAVRRERGIDGKGGKDMSHTKNGSIEAEDPSTNRARNRGKK
jgi:hypothetical protein